MVTISRLEDGRVVKLDDSGFSVFRGGRWVPVTESDKIFLNDHVDSKLLSDEEIRALTSSGTVAQ